MTVWKLPFTLCDEVTLPVTGTVRRILATGLDPAYGADQSQLALWVLVGGSDLENHEVTVRVRGTGHQVAHDWADTYIGIAPPVVWHVFAEATG